MLFHRFVRHYPLIAFFTCAYAFSWIMCLPFVVLGPAAYPVVFFLGGLGPCVAAVLVTGIQEGGAGVRKLIAGVCRWRVGLRWWALALFGFPLLMLASILVGHWVAGVPVNWKPPGAPSRHISVAMLVLSLPVLALLEEIGWRGYAWPALLKRRGFLAASTIVGTAWACWHLPLFFIEGMSHGKLPFLPYLGMAIVLSIWLGWLYCRTGSILLVTIFHASVNYSGLLPGGQNLPVLAVLAGTALVPTVVLVCVAGKRDTSIPVR